MLRRKLFRLRGEPWGEWHPWILLGLVVVLHHVLRNLLPFQICPRVVSEMGLTGILVVAIPKLVVLVRSILLVSIRPLLIIIIFEMPASAPLLNLLIILHNLFGQVPDHHGI